MVMLDDLATAIEEAVIDTDGSTLAAGYRLLDRLSARLAAAAAAFDRAQLWDIDDAPSMSAWLRVHAGRSGSEAARLVRTAAVVSQLPVVAAAWRDGVLTSAQVEVIATHVGRRHAERFADAEGELVPILADCDVADTAAAMRAWRAAADDADPAPEPDDPVQSVHLSEVGDRGVLAGDLAPETLGVVREALAVADSGDLLRPPAERRADALDTLCRFFLAHHDDRELRCRRRPRIALVVTPEQVATGAYGVDLCDSTLHRLLTAGRSVVIDYGRATRTISGHLRDLLDLRDQHCRFPGCDRPATWCDGHHVVEWEHGGRTDLDNLVLLCRRHHRRIHRPGYRAKLLPDATFEVTWPDGHTGSTDPPGLLPQPFW